MHYLKTMILPGIVFLLFISGQLLLSPQSQAAECLYVSSYHSGYEWNDGIERGIEGVLKGKCNLNKFYMDTKRNKSEKFCKNKALEAKTFIETAKPDIVIACDDNASKYLVMPYFKGSPLPIVFCGINWTVKPYGYPYSNVTGMIEISPIKQLLKQVRATVRDVKSGVYLGPDVISQRKEFQLNRRIYEKAGIEIRPIFVKNMAEWERGYKKAQQANFVIIGNNGGIGDWDSERAYRYVLNNTKILSVTNYDWMTRYAMLSMTKIAEEQGEWAASVALSILGGRNPGDIPIIANRRSNIYVNMQLITKVGVDMPSAILHKAVKITE